MKNKEIWFMRQAGRYLPEYRMLRKKAGSFFNLCFHEHYMCDVTLQPIERFDFSHAIIFSDILIIPFLLGYDITIDEYKGSPLLETLYKDDDIFYLKDYHYNKEKIEPILDNIKKIKEKLPKEKKLIGFCGAPWTLSIYMLQGKSTHNNQETFLWAYKNPEIFDHLITHLTETIIHYLKDQIASGCNVIQLFDSWAGFLSPHLFEKYIIEPHVKIISTLKNEFKNVEFIGFPRGAGLAYNDYVDNVKPDIVGCDVSLSIEHMKNLQKKCGVQGNLDPFLLLSGGDELKKQTIKLTQLYETGHYIFNLGHGILPQTPIKNVELVKKIVDNL